MRQSCICNREFNFVVYIVAELCEKDSVIPMALVIIVAELCEKDSVSPMALVIVI